MGFILPWEDPPWWAEESGESVTLGYGPKEWCKSPVIWERAKDSEHSYLYRDRLLHGIQRMEIEQADLDSVIDLLLAIRARRDGERPPVGLIRFGPSREIIEAARDRDEDAPWEYLRIDLADGWPNTVEHDGREYIIDALDEGAAGTSMRHYPVRDYFLKPRDGLTRPTARKPAPARA